MIVIEREIQGEIVQISHYQSADNDDLIELDNKSQMLEFLGGLIRISRGTSISYDNIIEKKGYKQGLVLVARIKGGPTVGKCAAAIKEVYLFGETHRVGYLFDMRIHRDYQRIGIGALFHEALVMEGVKRNVDKSTCLVSASNPKSLNFLMNKLRFRLGSEKKMFVLTASSQKFVPRRTVHFDDGSQCRLDYFEPGDPRISIHADKLDYFPADFSEITGDKHYQGCITATNGSNQSMIHIYKGDYEFSVGPRRLILSMDTWAKWYVRLLVFLLLMALPFRLITSSLTEGGYGKLIGGVVLGILLLVSQWAFYKVHSWFHPLFIYAFGYYHEGSNQKELVGELMKQLKSYVNQREKKTIRIVEDIRAPYLEYARKQMVSIGGMTSTVLLYRCDSEPLKHKNEYFSVRNFSDPRDL